MLIVTYLICLLCIGLIALCLYRIGQHYRRAIRKQCQYCGYPLTVSMKCSECGSAQRWLSRRIITLLLSASLTVAVATWCLRRAELLPAASPWALLPSPLLLTVCRISGSITATAALQLLVENSEAQAWVVNHAIADDPNYNIMSRLQDLQVYYSVDQNRNSYLNTTFVFPNISLHFGVTRFVFVDRSTGVQIAVRSKWNPNAAPVRQAVVAIPAWWTEACNAGRVNCEIWWESLDGIKQVKLRDTVTRFVLIDDTKWFDSDS